MKVRQVLYKGRVQGVGFRYSVKQIAAGFEVRGSIRNLPDGRVELQAEGDPGEVDAFLEAIRQSHLAAHIAGEETHPLTGPLSVRGFEIRP